MLPSDTGGPRCVGVDLPIGTSVCAARVGVVALGEDGAGLRNT